MGQSGEGGAPQGTRADDARAARRDAFQNAATAAPAVPRPVHRARRLADAVREQTGAPFFRGNRTRLLVDGPRTYAAMLAAVSDARDHVHVETYIFSDDEVGRRFADTLVAKRRAGVDVRIVYDAFGSSESAPAFFARMAAHGIEVAEFRPLGRPRVWRAHNRDHRKLTVVDGRIAFTGGLNITSKYAKASTSRPGPEKGLRTGWRDTNLEVRGPAVRALQSLFVGTWLRAGRRMDATEASLYPDLPEVGEDLVQILASEGLDEESQIFDAYLAAIRNARSRIWMAQAYFAPNAELRDALVAAAARGVDVRVIVPAFTDSALIFYGSRATYEELLEGGVALYEHEEALLHAKTAVVDGVWSTVGSSNLDPRSFLHNDELNAAILSEALGREMEAVFERDLETSRRIDPEAWKARPAGDRLKERCCNLVIHWL